MKFDFDKFLPLYMINTPLRKAAFMAQMHHESQGFTAIEENLNYSAHALLATWPNRFTPEIAANYARQPQKIANKVYADRMGNGNEASGDGWRYRGRGLIQITGKDNYVSFAGYKNISLADVVMYLGTADGALESACWYWKTRGLNAFADAGDIKGMTRRINGGLNGLDEREALYHRYMQEYKV